MWRLVAWQDSLVPPLDPSDAGAAVRIKKQPRSSGWRRATKRAQKAEGAVNGSSGEPFSFWGRFSAMGTRGKNAPALPIGVDRREPAGAYLHGAPL